MPFSAAAYNRRAKAFFPILSKRRRSARKKANERRESTPSSSLFLSSWLPVCVRGLFDSLSLFRLSLGAVPLSRIANDEARIDKGPSALSLSEREAATWNSTARDRKPIVSAALAGQSSEKPRPACLQRRSRKTGTSGCSHYACLPRPVHVRVCPTLLSRYRGNVFRPVRVHYRHAGRFTALVYRPRARPRLISRIYEAVVACASSSRNSCRISCPVAPRLSRG